MHKITISNSQYIRIGWTKDLHNNRTQFLESNVTKLKMLSNEMWHGDRKAETK